MLEKNLNKKKLKIFLQQNSILFRKYNKKLQFQTVVVVFFQKNIYILLLSLQVYRILNKKQATIWRNKGKNSYRSFTSFFPKMSVELFNLKKIRKKKEIETHIKVNVC